MNKLKRQDAEDVYIERELAEGKHFPNNHNSKGWSETLASKSVTAPREVGAVKNETKDK